MMAAEQRLRHRHAFVDFRTGVMRAVEQAVERRVEGVLQRGVAIVEHAGQQAHRSVHHGQGGQFAARQHEIAQ
ncbi:Uncharacterised protein [Bordetella pertussis]|nr:Uncharacterised protein [Bordetella pertussis]